MFFLFCFLIRKLKNINITLELPGPLSGPWTPAESEFSSAFVLQAHNLLRPLNENPGSAPVRTRVFVANTDLYFRDQWSLTEDVN